MQKTLSKKQFTIGELVYETGFKKRTIHYYSQKGVIPAPIGQGLGAYYTQVHLFRLKLINHMKKSHLKLTGIREAFNAMSVDDLETLLNKIENEEANWKLDSLENWMVEAPKTSPEDIPLFQRTRDVKEPEEQATYKTNYLETVKRKKPEATSWDKITLEDGVEVHIRSDKLRKKTNILDAVKQLLEEKDYEK